MQDDSCDEVFNCEQWGHDYYDCLGQDTRNCGDNPSCVCGLDGDVPDADGDCCSPLLIGNGSCDNASDACNMTEYSNDGGDCDSGDLNADGLWNLLDISALVTCVLGGWCGEQYGSAADLNQDGSFNLLDILSLANCVLDGNCAG